MDIFTFIGNSPSHLLRYAILAIVALFSFQSIGKLFLRGKTPISQALVGIGFIATINIFTLSFSAILTKYVLYISLSIALILFLFTFHKKDIVLYLKSLFIIFSIFLFYFVASILTMEDFARFYTYNSHSPYLYGIPIEIFHADYWSRIRILDNYPFEWSKYHLFNGSFLSFPLIFYKDKTVLAYSLSKIIIFSFFLAAVYEQIRTQINQQRALAIFTVLLLFCHIFLQHSFEWTLRTNNISSLFFLVLTFFYFLREEHENALVFTLLFALSTSRSILPGSLLFLYALYQMYRARKIHYHLAILCLYSIILYLAIFTTILTGESASTPLINGVSRLLKNGPWYALIDYLKDGLSFKAYLLFYFIMLYIAIRDKFIVLDTNIKKALVIVLLIVPLFESQAYILVYGYIFPLFVILMLGKDSFKYPLLIFYFGSFAQLLFLNHGVSLPNYALIIYLLLFVFIRHLKDYTFEANTYNYVSIFSILALILLNKPFFHVFPYYDRTTSVIELKRYKPDSLIYYYTSHDDEDLARLHVLKGGRVTFFDERATKDSMARSFSIKTEKNMKELELLLNSEEYSH